MSNGKEWLHPHLNNDGSDNDDDSLSVDSNDSLQNFINFQSHRNSTGLEEAISVTYPFDTSSSLSSESTLKISTILQEDELVPLFDGAGWAGTRVWSAAIWGIKYLIDNYGLHNNPDDMNKSKTMMSLCELGCGLGVPGMVWHQLGGNVVLTEQPKILVNLKQMFKPISIITTSKTREKLILKFITQQSMFNP